MKELLIYVSFMDRQEREFCIQTLFAHGLKYLAKNVVEMYISISSMKGKALDKFVAFITTLH